MPESFASLRAPSHRQRFSSTLSTGHRSGKGRELSSSGCPTDTETWSELRGLWEAPMLPEDLSEMRRAKASNGRTRRGSHGHRARHPLTSKMDTGVGRPQHHLSQPRPTSKFGAQSGERSCPRLHSTWLPPPLISVIGC